ncbi:coiled-coil domain-containing protein 137 [Stigmatopora nigra]
MKRKRRPVEQVGQPGKEPSAKKQKHSRKAEKQVKEENHIEHIPYRLRQIMRSMETMKSGSHRDRNHASVHRNPEKSTVGDIAIPQFKRGKNESVGKFLMRMSNETDHVRFLTKNQIERKPELAEAQLQELPALKGRSESKKKHDQKRAKMRNLKKWNQKVDRREKEMFEDYIPFGEVSMGPPSLTSKPKKATTTPQAPKDLLLNSLLGNAASGSKPSMARQRIMEEERERAVLAYRQLKLLKQHQQQEARKGRRKFNVNFR